jgi:arylformamidase
MRSHAEKGRLFRELHKRREILILPNPWDAGTAKLLASLGFEALGTMTLAAVKGGIAISGLYDLEPIRLNYLNEKLGLDEAEARRNSPILNFPPMAGPLVVTYGTAELPELCRQSIDYARAWVGRGLPGRLLPIDGADHFTIVETLARPDGELMQALLALIRG